LTVLALQTAATSSPVSESSVPISAVYKEIEDLKDMLAQQARVIADQTSQMQKLTSEIEALKSKLT
jgi:coronin-1B/1C/6